VNHGEKRAPDKHRQRIMQFFVSRNNDVSGYWAMVIATHPALCIRHKLIKFFRALQ
jgi:hypothetical protein